MSRLGRGRKKKGPKEPKKAMPGAEGEPERHKEKVVGREREEESWEGNEELENPKERRPEVNLGKPLRRKGDEQEKRWWGMEEKGAGMWPLVDGRERVVWRAGVSLVRWEMGFWDRRKHVL